MNPTKANSQSPYLQDLARYNGKPGRFLKLYLYLFRELQMGRPSFRLKIYSFLYAKISSLKHLEISPSTKIGGGIYLGHAYGITINPKAIIGNNCNIHKGVTIGQESRGKRKGTPIIGNRVWIGVGAVIVGNINIGDDVMIAPNSFVNIDIPSHSIVFGNPCIIKPRNPATQDYIVNTTEE